MSPPVPPPPSVFWLFFEPEDLLAPSSPPMFHILARILHTYMEKYHWKVIVFWASKIQDEKSYFMSEELRTMLVFRVHPFSYLKNGLYLI